MELTSPVRKELNQERMRQNLLLYIYNRLRKITDPVTPAREKSTETLIHEFYTLLKMAYYTLKSFSYQ